MAQNYKKPIHLGLALCPFLDPKTGLKIINNLSDNPDLSTINAAWLKNFSLKENLIARFISWKKTVNLGLLKQKLKEQEINLISYKDKEYPLSLKEIYLPPPFLFYRGNLQQINQNNSLTLAIVGSRKNSSYGALALTKILSPLSQKQRLVIISGLARGIDTLAHEQALKHEIPTIAILGSGLFSDKIYPPENLKLAKRIIQANGLLLSEFPPNCPPKKDNFPRRNRLISGLAKSVLVIEATEKSGALITARFALEQNKDILALPGNIFQSNSKGTNKLIQAGAYPVLNADDLLAWFDFKS
jgi:DNA processing protein